MTATAPESMPSPIRDTTIGVMVNRLEALLERSADRLADRRYFETLGEEMRLLHARLRSHHSSDQLAAGEQAVAIPSEYADQVQRLREEHSEMIGTLDRLVRGVDAMVDQPVEDKEVFFLRGRELIATIRRHEAEEDRLFYLAVWRDTGGES